MANAGEVLNFLCPDIEWTIQGFNYEDITWHNGTPAITKKEFEAGFAEYDDYKAEQDAQVQAKRQAALAKLTALGLNLDDLKALGL